MGALPIQSSKMEGHGAWQRFGSKPKPSPATLTHTATHSRARRLLTPADPPSTAGQRSARCPRRSLTMPLSWHRRAPRAPRRTQPLRKERHRGRADRAAAGLAVRRGPPTHSPRRTRPSPAPPARTPTPSPPTLHAAPSHPIPSPPLPALLAGRRSVPTPRSTTPGPQPAALTGAAPPARPGAANPEPPAPPPAPRRSNQQQDGGRRRGGALGRAVIATAPSNARPAALRGNRQPSPSRRGRSRRADRPRRTSVKPKAAPPLCEQGPPPDGRAR